MKWKFPILWLPFYLGCTINLLMPVNAQNLTGFEKLVTEFQLENGLKFLVVEKHEVPVVTMLTYADVGSVNEVKGITGLAHIFEHMAFKGTTTIGTKDLKKELKAMAKVDEIFGELIYERSKGPLADPERLKQLEEEFRKAQEEAKTWSNSQELGEVIERAGGVGLNATTDTDATQYFYSLPSNKIELWFALESERFLNPVLREFYTEKDVVMEERRLRTESNPIGRLLEEFTNLAFKAHPYGEPVVGHMSDLKSISRDQAQEFFNKYYGANNLTIVLVGDIYPSEIKRLAETYFNRLPKKPRPTPIVTAEPEQIGERTVVVEEEAQPVLILGYHKGSILHPDDPVFDVIADIIGRGRSSRLYKVMVKEKKIAVNVGAFKSYPGEKYRNLIIFYAIPSHGHTADECRKIILDEIEKLKNEPITAEELEKAKTRARADLVRTLDSRMGIAFNMAAYEVLTGDWRNMFRRLDQLAKVQAADIQRVAKETFVERNRTTAMSRTVPSKNPSSPNPSQP